MRKVSASVHALLSSSAFFCMSTSSAQNLSKASRGSSNRSTSMYSSRASCLVSSRSGTPKVLRLRSPNCAAHISMIHSCSAVRTKTHSWGCINPATGGTLRTVLFGVSSTVSTLPGCIANFPWTRPKLSTSLPLNMRTTLGVAMQAISAESVMAVQVLASWFDMNWYQSISWPKNFSAGSPNNNAAPSLLSREILLLPCGSDKPTE
mmetsp:Transcript_7245/g.12862  ORF Transcript_7245/g.12862 Transcript_7245/m.12862 type:complete len:206 (-) Transcript_7245:539-1156(-)